MTTTTHTWQGLTGDDWQAARLRWMKRDRSPLTPMQRMAAWGWWAANEWMARHPEGTWDQATTYAARAAMEAMGQS